MSFLGFGKKNEPVPKEKIIESLFENADFTPDGKWCLMRDDKYGEYEWGVKTIDVIEFVEKKGYTFHSLVMEYFDDTQAGALYIFKKLKEEGK